MFATYGPTYSCKSIFISALAVFKEIKILPHKKKSIPTALVVLCTIYHHDGITSKFWLCTDQLNTTCCGLIHFMMPPLDYTSVAPRKKKQQKMQPKNLPIPETGAKKKENEKRINETCCQKNPNRPQKNSLWITLNLLVHPNIKPLVKNAIINIIIAPKDTKLWIGQLTPCIQSSTVVSVYFPWLKVQMNVQWILHMHAHITHTETK